MGFYSFYRIFKDIFKTIFGSKIWRYLLIFIIIICFIFIFYNNKSFAVSPTPAPNLSFTIYNHGNEYTCYLPTWADNVYWVFLYKDIPNSSYIGYAFYYSATPIEISTNSNNVITLYGNKIGIWSGGTTTGDLHITSGSGNTPNGSSTSLNVNDMYNLNNTTFVCNHSITDHETGEIVFPDSMYHFQAPYITNISDISSGNPNGVYIEPGDFNISNNLYFHILKIDQTITDNSNTIYYYSSRIITLNNTTEYYKEWNGENNTDLSYFYIPRPDLRIDYNSSYLFVLSNSSDSYTNSIGLIQENESEGVYDVVQFNSQLTMQDQLQNIDDTFNDDNISDSTISSIDDSLNRDNSNQDLNNMNTGFFSRLTNMFSDLTDYDLSENTSVAIPLPHSNKKIILHSTILYNHVNGALRVIINAFWIYVFSFYMWKFINKIYIAVSTGNILDTFSSSGEAITNDML